MLQAYSGAGFKSSVAGAKLYIIIPELSN